VLADPEAARSISSVAPLVDRGDRDCEVVRQFLCGDSSGSSSAGRSPIGGAWLIVTPSKLSRPERRPRRWRLSNMRLYRDCRRRQCGCDTDDAGRGSGRNVRHARSGVLGDPVSLATRRHPRPEGSALACCAAPTTRHRALAMSVERASRWDVQSAPALKAARSLDDRGPQAVRTQSAGARATARIGAYGWQRCGPRLCRSRGVYRMDAQRRADPDADVLHPGCGWHHPLVRDQVRVRTLTPRQRRRPRPVERGCAMRSPVTTVFA
jgi:hypothetical protein